LDQLRVASFGLRVFRFRIGDFGLRIALIEPIKSGVLVGGLSNSVLRIQISNLRAKREISLKYRII
jgi:hypothetical protein